MLDHNSSVRTSPQSTIPRVAPEAGVNLHGYHLWTPTMTESTVTESIDLPDFIGLIDDEHVRSILVATSAEPLSAGELSDLCGVSVSSIYRRVEELEEADLVREQTRPRADGHHESVYTATLDRFELIIQDGEFDWTLERDEGDIADELTRLWGKF